jgi:drug/metabolite transporter (DMT)-like permease
LIADLPIYVVYAVAGTSAAALAKAAISRFQRREWRPALWRSVVAGLLLTGQFGLLAYLLSRADMAVLVPLAMGINLATAAVLGALFFRERVDVWKSAGMALIATGVWLVSAS